MNKQKREKINLFFSAFLILGYIVCTYFFMSLVTSIPVVPKTIISIFVFAIFGLLLFYATRVGDGKPVKRFSLIILLVVVLPCLVAILFGSIQGMPLHDVITLGQESVWQSPLFILACVALGYGVPYSFFSGFELQEDDEEEEQEEVVEEEKAPIEGGLKAELSDLEEEEIEEQTKEQNIETNRDAAQEMEKAADELEEEE